MRKATVAPRVAPWRASPSAVGRTPHEQSGSGVPMADAHRTDRILPRPRNRVSRRAGTMTAKTPARTNPSSRKKDASRRIDHASPATWSRKSLTRDPRAGGGDRGPAAWPTPGAASGLPGSLSTWAGRERSEEHTSELQSLAYLVCRLLLEKKKS